VRVSENGVAIPDLIGMVKQAIKTANVSNTDLSRDLRVSAVQLTLNVVATSSLGGGMDFRIPFVGMQIKLGYKVTKQNTHRIQINLVPPEIVNRPELREGDFSSVFVDAITTIRAAVAYAATGDDPFALAESSVNISFAITADGAISLGVDGGLANELTHTLTLSLVSA